jgi:hypothetical protein
MKESKTVEGCICRYGGEGSPNGSVFFVLLYEWELVWFLV